MISISGINVAFDKTIIKDAKIEIDRGKITAIVGESGSGKTSLLYIVGMLAGKKWNEYKFDGESIKDDSQINYLKKCKIGYVLQDNSLFEHLSVYENMRIYADLVSSDFSELECQTILDSMNIKVDMHRNVSTLSGGEKQRVAITCAVIKNPDLLILDEPTSALDQYNAKIVMDLIVQLAKKGIMILVASHDDFVVDFCDVVYQIENEDVILEKGHCETNNINYSNKGNNKIIKSLSLSFYVRYFYNFMRNHIKDYSILFSVISLVLAILLGLVQITTEFEKIIEKNINDISSREILVSRFVQDSVLTQNDITWLSNNPYVQNSYPFYLSHTDKLMFPNKEFYLDVIIQPYSKEMKYDNFVEVDFNNQSNIYLSYELSNQIGLKNAEQSVSFEMILPNQESVYFGSIAFGGILNNSINSKISKNDLIIYYPIEDLPKIKEVPSLLIYSSHYQTTDELINSIKAHNSNYVVDSDYENIEVYSEMMRIIHSLAPLFAGIVTIVVFFMTFMIYAKLVQNRKKEIYLLKVNGLKQKELVYLILCEIIIQTFAIATLTFLLLGILKNVLNSIYSMNFHLRLLIIYVQCILSVLVFLVPPSMISLHTFLRVSPSHMIRNE